MPALAGSTLATVGLELARAYAAPSGYGDQSARADAVIAERLLLQHVMEQILKDISRTMTREYRRQEFEQRLMQERLDEQRRLERYGTKRRRDNTPDQMAAAQTAARPEDATWNSANRSTRK